MATKIDRICRKNAISSSADPRTPRLLTSHMYVHESKCTYMHYIQSYIYIYIYVCVYVMPFLEVTILFNQHFTIVGNIVGKSLPGILTIFI